MPDFIALRGDPSDGLPGAKGIGEKTAADLLREHGSLEGAIAAALTQDAEDPWRAARPRGRAADLQGHRDAAPRDVERPADRETDTAGAAAAARERGLAQLAERLEEGGA